MLQRKRRKAGTGRRERARPVIRRQRFVSWLVIGGLLASLPGARVARAMDRDVRAVLAGGAYGLVGGTALGLASYPFTQRTRNIFVGTSIGLYLGLVVGFYHVWHRDDPENPLRVDAGGVDAPAGPVSAPPALFEARFAVVRF
jgi:hypothetical protein